MSSPQPRAPARKLQLWRTSTRVRCRLSVRESVWWYKAAIEVTSRKTRQWLSSQLPLQPGFDDQTYGSRRQMCALVCEVLECAFEGLMDGPMDGKMGMFCPIWRALVCQ